MLEYRPHAKHNWNATDDAQIGWERWNAPNNTNNSNHTDERTSERVLHRQKSVKITNNSNSNGIPKRSIWFGIHTCAQAIQAATTTIINFISLNRNGQKKWVSFEKVQKKTPKQNKIKTFFFCYSKWNNSTQKSGRQSTPYEFEIYFTPTTYTKIIIKKKKKNSAFLSPPPILSLTLTPCVSVQMLNLSSASHRFSIRYRSVSLSLCASASVCVKLFVCFCRNMPYWLVDI